MPLVTRSPRYVLEVDPEASDSRQFERLLERGRDELADGRPDSAARLLRDAFERWRGRPFDDLGDPPFARAEAARLEELRLQTLEDRIDADLLLGRAEALVPELQSLVGRDPYRERLRGQLMLALYRSGRQADALAAYRDARRLFVDQLGIEPGRELQELERAILQQDPSLASRATATHRARKPPRLRWVAAAALLVAIVGAVSAIVALAGGSGRGTLSAAPDSIAVIDPKSNRLVDTVPMGSTPIEVAVGEGAVWVVNSQDGTLSRIDPGTRKVTRTIGLGTPASDVAVGFGSVWVANGTACSLTRVDPRTGAPAETLHQLSEQPLVSPAALGVATGEGSLWLTSGTERVLRIDPATGRTIATIPVPAGPLAVGVGEGAVWIGSLARRVSRIAPRTNEVTASVPVGDEAEGIAAGVGAVWAAVCCDSGGGSTRRPTCSPGPSASVLHPACDRHDPRRARSVDVAVGYGAVWVAVERRNVS
jgi:YVTN family beta-propeller protein